MAYVVFEGRHQGNTGSPSTEPMISFGADGHITLNKAAMEALNYTHKVCLLWDAGRHRIGLTPADFDDPNGYVIQRPGSHSCGQVHARGFSAFVGRKLNGLTLCVSLDGDGLYGDILDAEYIEE